MYVCMYVCMRGSKSPTFILPTKQHHNIQIYKDTHAHLKQTEFEFTQPEIEDGSQKCFAMPFGPNLQLKRRQNAETAWQNAFVNHLLDFGPDKLRRNSL